jgi:hypothetical protein
MPVIVSLGKNKIKREHILFLLAFSFYGTNKIIRILYKTKHVSTGYLNIGMKIVIFMWSSI